MRSGIKTPLSFDKGPNLSDSDNVVLDLSPGSGSLPSRDYYTEDNFAVQRGQFKEHLSKVAALVGGLDPDFAERVLRYETKLAQIGMKPDQGRQFDQYFTVTTLEGFVSGVNEMKSLPEKLDNYAANAVAGDDPDAAVLREREYKLDDKEGHAAAFVRRQVTHSGPAAPTVGSPEAADRPSGRGAVPGAQPHAS